MRARRLAGVSGIATGAALMALAPAAHGGTLGSAERPLDAATVFCSSVANLVGFQAAETTTSWTVPGRGVLASWSTNVAEADPGRSASLVVLRRAGADLTIAALDTAALPPQPPSGGIATFRPASRIVLEPGDRLGITGTFGAICGWQNGELGSAERATVWEAAPSIAPGATLTEWWAPQAATRINLAAQVHEATDLRVAAAAGPAGVVVGGLAQLSGTVSNAGPAPTPVRIADAVPAGLSVVTAVAGGGSCAVAGQQVTCEIPSLAPGASVPVVILVTPTAPGAYVNALAAEPALDSAPADNSASATLAVAAPPAGRGEGDGRDRGGGEVGPPAPSCVVPRLARAPLAVARGVLRQLRCTPARVTKRRSKRVARGAVISTRPGRGEYRAGTSVRLVVSAGAPARRGARGRR